MHTRIAGGCLYHASVALGKPINLKNPNSKKPLLCEDEVELLTSPFDLAEYKNAIMDSMHKGTKRNIESEFDSKNTKVG